MNIMKITQLRYTAVGILIRKQEDTLQLGTHIATKAIKDCQNPTRRSTVQGRIKPLESTLAAMHRNLSREYGSRFAKRALVTQLRIKPTWGISKDGTPKVYHWCEIQVPSGINPIPNEEVFAFFWDNLSDAALVCEQMSLHRARVIQNHLNGLQSA